MGDARRAIGYYEQALVIAREIGDRRGEGTCPGQPGDCVTWATPGGPSATLSSTLKIAREIGDRRGEGNALATWGVRTIGRRPAGHRLLRASRRWWAIIREIGTCVA